MHVPTPIRLILVDESSLVCEGLAALLRQATDVTLSGHAASLDPGIAMLRQHQADVLLLGRASGGISASDAVRRFAQATSAVAPASSLLILSGTSSTADFDSLLLAGARGVLGPDAGVRELLDALRTIAQGQVYRPHRDAPTARATGHAPLADGHALNRLTDRERDVFLSTALGYSAPEIAARLNISAKTVDTYKLRIHEKLGVHHRSEYVQLALRARLIGEPGPE